MNFGQQLPPLRTDGFGKRGSGDFSSPQLGNGEIPMSGPPNGHLPMTIPGHTRGQSQYGAGFAADRSPPKQKSTSHVPCKFFPIGQCQAGAACQFSHDLNPVTQNAPCKYFAKGSCKFGQGCALMHILPDGSIVNRGTRGGHGYGRRNTHNGHMYQQSTAAPMAINTNDFGLPSSEHVPPYQPHGLGSSYTHQPASPNFTGEMYSGDVSPPYGSPQNDYMNPVRSPPRPGIRARDAPMPSSWDSQGISQAARHGPFAASVPGRFGLDSPISQLGNHIARDQTFGDTANLDGVLHGLGSSPRGHEALTFPKRPLHSERFARSRPFLSSSLNIPNSQFSAFDDSTPDDADDSDDGTGEGCLPSSLHELLSDDEPRRTSRGDLGGEDENTSHWSTAPRRIASNGANAEMKTGSLSPHSASPSRYSAIFGARKPDANRKTESDTTSLSAFGHVGSPLRPSNLRTSSTHTTSPPEAGSGSLSMLTSQLQRAKLNDSASGSPTGTGSAYLSPSSSANAPSSRVAPTSGPRFGQGPGPVERSLSGSFSNTLGRERIEEESIFSMEEETGVLGESEAEPSAPPPRNAWSMGPPRIGSVGVIGSQRNK